MPHSYRDSTMNRKRIATHRDRGQGERSPAPRRCDYVQVPLECTATVTRPDATVRVVLSGPVG
jgi:hypothetical protein